MPAINKIKKLRMIVAMLFFWSIIIPCFSQKADLLAPNLLSDILIKKLPKDNREQDVQEDVQDLYNDLQYAQILTVKDLNILIDTYLDEVLSIEKDICTQLVEKASLYQEIPNVSESSENTYEGKKAEDIDESNITEVLTEPDSTEVENIEFMTEMEDEEEDSDLYEFDASVSIGTYSAQMADIEHIKQGVFFTMTGLTRTMIVLNNKSKETVLTFEK